MSISVNAATDEIYRILTSEGKLVGKIPDLSDERLVQFYRWMVFGRLFSGRMVALQRQGRMGTFGPIDGQEAALVGLTAPLQQEDWLIGSYREILSYYIKGVPVTAMMERYGGGVGGDYPREANTLPVQIIISAQMLHAVGVAMAIKYEQKPHVVVAVCGDGATSEGEFNEALNFAGVFKAPIVFVVQNNGWAISMPREKQTAAEYIANRGPAFGMPGYVVDGNDVLAVYQLMDDCVARARAGDGPTLVEAITYRLGAHTTADDPTKYRDEAELEAWKQRDPLTRFRKFLMDRELLTEADDQTYYEEAKAEIQEAVETFEASPPLAPSELFDLVYAEQSPQLQRQREKLLKELGLDE